MSKMLSDGNAFSRHFGSPFEHGHLNLQPNTLCPQGDPHHERATARNLLDILSLIVVSDSIH